MAFSLEMQGSVVCQAKAAFYDKRLLNLIAGYTQSLFAFFRLIWLFLINKRIAIPAKTM